MFVVPLYAFLTTTVPKSRDGADRGGQQYRQFGRDGAGRADADRRWSMLGVSVAETLLLVAVASLGAAWLAWKLHKACD